MKEAVWIVFYISLVGMTLSAILRFAAAREAIVDLWVATSARLEDQSSERTLVLVRRVVAALYEGEPGRVSVRKLAVLALISAVCWTTYLTQVAGLWTSAQAHITSGYPKAVIAMSVLAVSLFTSPIHFFIEYLIARRILKTFSTKTISVASAIKGLIVILSSYLSATVILITLSMNLQMLKPFIGPLAFAFGPAALSVLYLEGQISLSGAVAGLLPLLTTYASSLLFVAVALAIANSNTALRMAAMAAEKISAQSHDRLFIISVLIFSIATGLMQAWGF